MLLKFIVTPGRTATLMILLKLKEFGPLSQCLSISVITELKEGLYPDIANDVKPNKWAELKESKLFDKTYLGNTNQTAITGTCLTSLLKNDSNMS